MNKTVDDFLKNGGKITYLAPDVMLREYSKSKNNKKFVWWINDHGTDGLGLTNTEIHEYRNGYRLVPQSVIRKITVLGKKHG